MNQRFGIYTVSRQIKKEHGRQTFAVLIKTQMVGCLLYWFCRSFRKKLETCYTCGFILLWYFISCDDHPEKVSQT